MPSCQMRTWPGRASIRKDTCRLDVITLDVNERVSAFIWSKEVLPFDCVRVLPVPEPIGGILVFAVNNLFYLNQGVPPYGVSLNSLGDNIDNVVSELIWNFLQNPDRVLTSHYSPKHF